MPQAERPASVAAFFVYAVALKMVARREMKCSCCRGRAGRVGHVPKRVAGDVNSPTIFRNVTRGIRKNIVVLYPSPEVYKPSIVLTIKDLLWRNEATDRSNPAL